MARVTNDGKKLIPTYFCPPHLTCLAAGAVVRLLVYDDYDDCNFYRWDPVRVWQFETPQPKKKRGKKKNNNQESPQHAIKYSFGHPPPPWKEILKFRNWWMDGSIDLLGSVTDSPIRHHIIDAFERQSWTAMSDEENVLFLLLGLCIDIQYHFGSCMNPEIPIEWSGDISLIIDHLGPFPLQKLTIDDEMFEGNPGVLATIIQNSPNLQILRIGQWDLNNDILHSIGTHCPLLIEFCISKMENEIFMSDVAFFKCFFDGMTPDEVIYCHLHEITPRLSFKNLKYVDLLFCKQTERLIQMVSFFYPRVSFSSFDAGYDELDIAKPFLSIGSKIPFVRVSARTRGYSDKRLSQLKLNSPYLREFRIMIDSDCKLVRIGNDCPFQRAGDNLCDYMGHLLYVDSLTIRPIYRMSLDPILGPTLLKYGCRIKCLNFVFDKIEAATNVMYPIINNCPFLEKLVISVGIFCRDGGSRLYKVELNEMPFLETLVLMDCNRNFTYGAENRERPLYIVLARTMIRKAPNLKNLSFNCWEMLLDNFVLYSATVEKLHLCFSGPAVESKTLSYCCHWLKKILPNFPRLKVLSLDGGFERFWSECLNFLQNREIIITKKKQEFANIFQWEESVHINPKHLARIM